MGAKVREWKGARWLFIDHKGKRKARRVGVGRRANVQPGRLRKRSLRSLRSVSLWKRSPLRNP
jgi:hypothetical protein